MERDFAIVQPGGSSGAAVVLVLSAAATAGVLTVAVETLPALLDVDGFADDFAEENAGCARTPSKSVSNASRLGYKKIASLFYRF